MSSKMTVGLRCIWRRSMDIWMSFGYYTNTTQISISGIIAVGLRYTKHQIRYLNVVVRFLLEQGADVNACDYYGFTPLHLASRNGMLEVARLLVEHGADINAEDNEGMTPLKVASGRDIEELL